MSPWYARALRQSGAYLDSSYAQIVHRLSSSKFFSAGWGDISRLSSSKFNRFAKGVQRHPEQYMTVEWLEQRKFTSSRTVPYEICEGQLTYFGNGIADVLDSIPDECKDGRVWLVRPAPEGATAADSLSACVVQLAATGEFDSTCAIRRQCACCKQRVRSMYA